MAFKPFAAATIEGANGWRRKMTDTEGDGLAIGTLPHRASHLRQFFAWAGDQPGLQQLAALTKGFDLPRRFHAKNIPEPRLYPAIEEAYEMLDQMRRQTLAETRARAIFAFLTGGGEPRP